MSKESKVVKSVAFNIDDPIERAMLKYAQEHPYFSTFVKRIIQRDMEKGDKVISGESGIVKELIAENKKLKEQLEAIKQIVNGSDV